jgi:hypothetical protein
VQPILKSVLNLYPYKMTALPKLTVQNKHQGTAFIEWAQSNDYIFNNVCFSDEAHFHLDGVDNKQSVRFWASEYPCVIHEKRITVRVAISSHGLLGPIFFEEKVLSECCLSILCNTFVPHLATGLPLQTRWFMQDGARLHTANVVLDSLHDTFNSHHLQLISWSFHMWRELAP